MRILHPALALCLLGLQAPAQRPQPETRPHHPPIVRPHRPVRPLVVTESTRVTAKIVDGVASTRVLMKFRNHGTVQGEKILLFPLPKGATADGIEMLVGGRLEKGEVLSSRKARTIYESIVRRRRDPALLEYMDRDLLRLRVFPIPPRGHLEVTVRFRLLLPESGGMHKFEFPTRAVEQGTFAMDVSIASTKAIKNVYSPISGFDISRKDDYHARASYESRTRPKRDPVLFYGLSDRDFGLNLLTYRGKGGEGYFLLMLAPKRDWKREKELRKSITFVLDTSGSMAGQKIAQAKGALRFFLKSLKKGDFFNLVPFSTEARPFAEGLVPAEGEQLSKALGFVEGIEARGGTNIHEALTLALSKAPREGTVPILVFLTDGLPTIGQTDVKEILKDCRKANTRHTRVFVFGVGHDVNTQLLDKLASEAKGTRDYVGPGEDIEVKTSALFAKLAHPVLTDLALKADKVQWSRMVPSRLPDLFRGSRLVIAGRYVGRGATAIRLEGKVGGETRQFVFEGSFPEVSAEQDFVATIWAQRRIGQLLDGIRLNGQSHELVSEIKRIGKEHGIVTPFTSQLIVEEGARVARHRGGDFPASGGAGWLPGGRAPSTPMAPTGLGAGRPDPAAGLPESARRRIRRDLERAGAEPPGEEKEKNELGDAGDDFGLGRGAGGKHAGKKGRSSGARAVSISRKTARLHYLSSLDQRGMRRLWRTQRIRGRTFYLVGGVWIDRDYERGMEEGLKKITAFSPGYFAFLRQHPELAPYLAFSTSIVIVIGRKGAVEVLPPEGRGKPPPGKVDPPPDEGK